MQPSDCGRHINESEAHDYVERCKAYRNSLIDGILPLVPADAADAIKNSAMFYDTKINAWLFDAELVKALFTEPNPARYFAVFLGATASADPIVVLAGLNAIEGEPNTLMAAVGKSASEQPKLLDHVKFPGIANGPIIVPE